MPAPTVDTDREVLTLEQTADLLQVPVTTMRRWRERKAGPPAYRVGKHLRFVRIEVLEWLSTQRADNRPVTVEPVSIREPRARRRVA